MLKVNMDKKNTLYESNSQKNNRNFDIYKCLRFEVKVKFNIIIILLN